MRSNKKHFQYTHSAKMNFKGFPLLGAHNSHFKYDIISLCETSLNMETKVPENIFKGYNFFPQVTQVVKEKGGGYFTKTRYPRKIRRDLLFEECIVTELNLGRKKCFFTVLQQSFDIVHQNLQTKLINSGLLTLIIGFPYQ